MRRELLTDAVVERAVVGRAGDACLSEHDCAGREDKERGRQGDKEKICVTVLLKPGVMDPVSQSALAAAADLGIRPDAFATVRKYWFTGASADEIRSIGERLLANDAIEQVFCGPLSLERLELGRPYRFERRTTTVRDLDDAALMRLSREGQLYLQLAEMQTIRQHFRDLGREPTDVELETIAQTWSEHCSHKTLAGRIAYRDEHGERQFENMLKETIFAATQKIRQTLGADDWCVSVFEDNAGVVRFDDEFNVAFKVETHNHPSALEPYGGANTGVGGVIRDIMGTGLGAKPICSTDVFCFAPPDGERGRQGDKETRRTLPPGVLDPCRVMRGVVEGVRDYGNRMGIPTVNGAVYFDERYLGNPLVYCGNVGLIARDKSHKEAQAGRSHRGGGRSYGARRHSRCDVFQCRTHQPERTGFGRRGADRQRDRRKESARRAARGARPRAVQRRDRLRGGRIQQCRRRNGRERSARKCTWTAAPLKYEGLSYTEIWISEAQERMVLAVPEDRWPELDELCRSEGVEATVIGRFVPSGRLHLYYHEDCVADLEMRFLHKGRPPVVRKAVYEGRGARGDGRGPEELRIADCGLRKTSMYPKSEIRNPKSIQGGIDYNQTCSKSSLRRTLQAKNGSCGNTIMRSKAGAS